MLKKNNKILIGCLALLLVMAVGYALFSETITINGTATAKGEFDMTVTCVPGLSSGIVSKLGESTKEFIDEEGGYENDSCVPNGDNGVTYSVNFLYPEAFRFFTVKITNNGSMDAVLDLSNGGLVMEEEVCDDKNQDEVLDPSECSIYEDADDMDHRTLDLRDTIFEDSEKNLYGESDSGTQKYYDGNTLKLEPGESTYMILKVSMPHYFTGWYNNQQQKFLIRGTGNIQFKFNQPTVN